MSSFIPDINIVRRVVESDISVSLMQDHANPAKATAALFDEICKAEAEAQDVSFGGSDKGHCGDHKRSNTLKRASKDQQAFLTAILGEKEFKEWGQIVPMLYRQLSNQFGGRGAAYEHGRGVDSYPAYMADHHPSKYRNRLSAVGSHYDYTAESALTTVFTGDNDLEYLLYLSRVKKGGLNQMENKLVRLLSNTEVRMAVKAEAFLWVKLFLPLRLALNEHDMDLRILEMNPYYLRIADLLLKWSSYTTTTERGCDSDLNIESATFFPFRGLTKAKLLEGHFKNYRALMAEECEELEKAVTDDESDIWRRCFQVMCNGAYTTWVEFSCDQLPKGKHVTQDGKLAGRNLTQDLRQRMQT